MRNNIQNINEILPWCVRLILQWLWDPKGCFIDCMIELFLILLVSFRWLRLWFHCQKEVTTILTLKEEIIDMQSKIQSREELNSKRAQWPQNTKFELVYGYHIIYVFSTNSNRIVFEDICTKKWYLISDYELNQADLTLWYPFSFQIM